MRFGRNWDVSIAIRRFGASVEFVESVRYNETPEDSYRSFESI
jgi:hypothetical protein